MKQIKFYYIVFFFISTVSYADINKEFEIWKSNFKKVALENNISEKTFDIVRIDMNNGNKYFLEHNLDFYNYGQGGLLDILYKDGYVYVSYSEDRESGNSSTSIARGLYIENKIDFQNIFQAEPPINSGYHFGSRIVIKDKHLFASVVNTMWTF